MKSNSSERSVRVAQLIPQTLALALWKDKIRTWSGVLNTQVILTPRDPAVAAATAAREPVAPGGVDHRRDLLGSHVRSQGARPADRLAVCLRREAALPHAEHISAVHTPAVFQSPLRNVQFVAREEGTTHVLEVRDLP